MKIARLLVAAPLVCLSCGDVAVTEEGFEHDQAPIAGGALIAVPQGAPDTSVVKLEMTDGFGQKTFCSAIKIATNTFWTAGHCIQDAGNVVQVRVTNDTEGNFTGPSVVSTTFQQTIIHPSLRNFNKTVHLGFFPKHFDIGRFSLVAATPNIPAYSTTDSGFVGSGLVVKSTAYGCNDSFPTRSGKKQVADFTTATLAQVRAAGQDIPFLAHNIASVGGPQLCEGDSGAPAFRVLQGVRKIVGIAATGNQDPSGFARYGSVRNFLALPLVNNFAVGFQGFIFNRFTGRCVSGAIGAHPEADCDGRAQDADFQSWRLANSGTANQFYLVNGSTFKCLDLNTTAAGSTLVQRTCLAPTPNVNTQKWRFDTTNNNEYRRLVNVQTGRCTTPANPNSTGSDLVSNACSSSEPTWNHQAWIMTR